MSEKTIDAPPEAGDHEHGDAHYVKIWAVLVVLLVISVVGPMLEIRVVTLITAFGIAVVKAYLVCKHFMHLNVQPRYVAYFLGVSVLFLVVLFAGVAPDVLLHEGRNWDNEAARAEVERGLAAQGEGAATEEAPFEVTATFAATCGPCHGAGGAGDGAAAAGLDPHPANFTDPEFWETRDRQSVIETITGGGPAVGRSALMPAFGDTYTDEQIEQLADHVLGFAPEGALEPVELVPDGGAEAMDGAVEATEDAPTDGPAPEGDEAPVEPLPEAAE